MNIYAEPGSKVRFLGKNGHDYDLTAALKVLTPGAVYTVNGTTVENWSSTVTLDEVEGEFNTVMFEDVP